MTKTRDFILKPWIVALSLGATLGGWAMLARHDFVDVGGQVTQAQATPAAVINTVNRELPPVPTVEALTAYASPNGALSAAGLPQVPAIVAPAPRSRIVQAPQPQTPPVTTTRSSR
jgi:hypothetical protein